MKFLLKLGWVLVPALLSAQTLTLTYSSGDFWTDDGGRWILQSEGATLRPDQTVKLSPGSTATVHAPSFDLCLSNPGTTPKAFSLAKAMVRWQKTAAGQDLVAAQVAQWAGPPGSGAKTAAMGVRADNMGHPEAQTSTSDVLWAQAQADLQAGDHPKAIAVLTELLDYAEGDRLVDTAVLLAQQDWVVRDWTALDQWVPRALALPEVPTEQKQLILYLASLGALARDQDPQPLWDQIQTLDPTTDLARSLSPPPK